MPAKTTNFAAPVNQNPARTTNPCSPVDPCACAPGQDKQIIFNEDTCLSASPNLLWDYTSDLLSVDGAIGASGSIASSAQIEGAYAALQALGTGSFNFTPPSGYGGLLYRGGAVFYYWNNSTNSWDEIDFSGEVVSSQINVAHNGAVLGATGVLNFVDSSTITWSITQTGDINVSVPNTWVSNVNANGYSITNLYSINGIPVTGFMVNPWNSNVNANGYSLNNVNNLSVTGSFTYKGLPIEDYFGSDLWILNADGSISRNSNVYITGTGTPLTVTSQNNNNYLFLDTSGSGSQFAALGTKLNGTYAGELGWSPTGLELWTANSLILQGTDATGVAYFPGFVGVRNSTPQFPLDVLGTVNASACYYVAGAVFACSNGAGGINLSNITNINGAPPGGGGSGQNQTPWLSNIDGGRYSLTNVFDIDAINDLSADNNVFVGQGLYIGELSFALSNGTNGIDLTNVDSINGAPYPPTVGPGGSQTPWLSNINGANFQLNNVSFLGIGAPSISNAGIYISLVTSTMTGIVMQQTAAAGAAGVNMVNNLSNVCQTGITGSSSTISPNTFNMNTNSAGYTWSFTNAEKVRLNTVGLGINNANPQYPIDIIGDANITGCYRVGGTQFACPSGGGVNLSNIGTINGVIPGGVGIGAALAAYINGSFIVPTNGWAAVTGCHVTATLTGSWLVIGNFYYNMPGVQFGEIQGGLSINGVAQGQPGGYENELNSQPINGFFSAAWVVHTSSGDTLSLIGQMLASSTTGVFEGPTSIFALFIG